MLPPNDSMMIGTRQQSLDETENSEWSDRIEIWNRICRQMIDELTSTAYALTAASIVHTASSNSIGNTFSAIR